MSFKEKTLQFYNRYEVHLQVGFFLVGFIFDYAMASDVDDPWVLLQQVIYLLIVAWILSKEHLVNHGLSQVTRFRKVWEYRGLILSFILGTLLNIYSFFFLKSASLFNSIVFVLFLLVVTVANELPQVQKSGVNLRWALWTLCVFSFFSILFPPLLGFIGWIPFLLSAAATGLCLYLHARWLMKKQSDWIALRREFIQPGGLVIISFLILYFLKLIPPVPLALESRGIYHQVERKDGVYLLTHQKPWWKFWHKGDQDFYARPGDQLVFFGEIFSPARFADEVIVHWLYKDPRQGWVTSDKVRMAIVGGRKQGFRGYSVKKNYQPGDWRVQVETTDGREIGRIYLEVIPETGSDERVWEIDRY